MYRALEITYQLTMKEPADNILQGSELVEFNREHPRQSDGSGKFARKYTGGSSYHGRHSVDSSAIRKLEKSLIRHVGGKKKAAIVASISAFSWLGEKYGLVAAQRIAGKAIENSIETVGKELNIDGASKIFQTAIERPEGLYRYAKNEVKRYKEEFLVKRGTTLSKEDEKILHNVAKEYTSYFTDETRVFSDLVRNFGHLDIKNPPKIRLDIADGGVCYNTSTNEVFIGIKTHFDHQLAGLAKLIPGNQAKQALVHEYAHAIIAQNDHIARKHIPGFMKKARQAIGVRSEIEGVEYEITSVKFVRDKNRLAGSEAVFTLKQPGNFTPISADEKKVVRQFYKKGQLLSNTATGRVWSLYEKYLDEMDDAYKTVAKNVGEKDPHLKLIESLAASGDVDAKEYLRRRARWFKYVRAFTVLNQKGADSTKAAESILAKHGMMEHQLSGYKMKLWHDSDHMKPLGDKKTGWDRREAYGMQDLTEYCAVFVEKGGRL